MCPIDYIHQSDSKETAETKNNQGEKAAYQSTEERLLAAADCYAKLLKEYKEEIDWQKRQLRELRKEKEKFIKETIPSIKDNLLKENVPENIIFEWIEQLKKEMDISFKLSEDLISTFYIETKNEFRARVLNYLDEEFRNDTVKKHSI